MRIGTLVVVFLVVVLVVLVECLSSVRRRWQRWQRSGGSRRNFDQISQIVIHLVNAIVIVCLFRSVVVMVAVVLVILSRRGRQLFPRRVRSEISRRFFFFFFFICVRVCQSPLPRLPLLLSLPLLAVRPDLSIEMMAPLELVLLSSLSLPPSSPSSSSPTMRRHRLPRGMRLHRIGRRTKQQSTDVPLGDSNDVVVVVVVAVLPTSQREGRARQQHDRFEKQAKDAEGGGMSRQCRGEGQVMSGEEGGEGDGESAVVLVVIVGGYDDVDVIVAAIIVVGEEVEAR